MTVLVLVLGCDAKTAPAVGATDNTVEHDTAAVDTAADHTSVEQDTAAEDPAGEGDTASGDTAAGDTAAGDTAGREPSSEDTDTGTLDVDPPDDEDEPEEITTGLRPYAEDVRYWEYRGEPVLPMGVSATDHLFLAGGHEVHDLEAHLDEMVALGANYVRNTMSQREPWPLLAYDRDDSGRYDLDAFHDDYWQRFEEFLLWTADRQIFVQIEVWDRFDFSRDRWELSPWNPGLNVNYTVANSQLEREYPEHPNRDLQPFFHGVPGHPEYEAASVSRRRAYDRVRGHQEAFVSKILSYSLNYDHVLYVMNNETSTHASWGQHWMEFIRAEAADRGVQVYCSDMFNDLWDPAESEHLEAQLEDIDSYPFIDVSQVNSRSRGDGVRAHSQHHWDRMMFIIDAASDAPRPINHTKVYDTGYYGGTPDGPIMGMHRLTLDLLAGSASARFHRTEPAFPVAHQDVVRALRMVESRVRFWDVEPRPGLLSRRAEGEAFLAADPGEAYILYFPQGGEVRLQLSDAEGTDFTLEWVELSTATSGTSSSVSGGERVTITAPDSGSWIATLTH